jgi:hypothetical protein
MNRSDRINLDQIAKIHRQLIALAISDRGDRAK